MGRPAAEDIPLDASNGQLAKALKVTERAIAGRKSDGRLPITETGKIDLHALLRLGVEEAARRHAAGTSAADPSGLDAARIEVLNEQRDRLRLLNAQIRGDSVTAEDVEAIVGALADAVRAKVLALPTKAAGRLVGMTSAADMKDALTGMVHEALQDLADTSIVPAVQDRARRRVGGMAVEAVDA